MQNKLNKRKTLFTNSYRKHICDSLKYCNEWVGSTYLKTSFIACIQRFVMTLDQETLGSSPSGAARKGLKMECFQTFFFLIRQKSTMTFGFWLYAPCMHFSYSKAILHFLINEQLKAGL